MAIIKRNASAQWSGTGKEGKGAITTQSGVLSGTPDSFSRRFGDEKGTNPEELIAAAHSTCFSMALSNGLAKDGYPPTSLDTRADVTFQPGPGITGIKLTVTGVVPGVTAEQFEAAAQDAKQNCPVSKALTGTTITLEASLAG